MLSQRQYRRWLAFGWGLLMVLTFSYWPLSGVAQESPSPLPPPVAIVAQDTVPTSPLEAGRLFHRRGQYPDAIAAWKTAVQEFERVGDRGQQALALSYLSMAYQDLADWPAATTAIEQSLALLTTDPTSSPAILLAQALNTQATLIFHQSQFQPAYDLWQQARQYYTEAGDQLGAWGAQINQAQALKELGFYRRANAELFTINKALADTPDSELKVTGLRTLGTALQAIGNNRIAYDAYAQSLKIAQVMGLHNQVSGLHTQIGKLAFQLGNLDTAMDYFQAAAADATHPIDTLHAYLGALAVYTARSQEREAGLVAEQIYEQLVTLPPSRAQIYGVINLARQMSRVSGRYRRLSHGQLDRLLTAAIESANHFHDQRAVAHALRERGRLYQQTQQRGRAIELTQQSVTVARTIQAADVTAQAAEQLARLLRIVGDREGAIAAYTEAVNALQSLRGDLITINQELQFSFREEVEPIYRELVSLLLDGTPGQADLEQARNTIEGLQLAELDNFFQEACLDLKEKSIDQIDPAATVMYPMILPDKFAVIIAQAGQELQYTTTAINQRQLDGQLRQLLASLHPSADHRQQLANAQRLYDLLIRPAETQGLFENTETLVFVLDGVMRNIPMAVLHDGQQYLIEKYAIALSPGLQLLQAQSLDQQKLKALVGGISEARGGFSPLPEVEREVETIAQTVSASTLLNAAFTSQAVSQSLKTSPVDVVHLATHGQFSSNLEETFFLTWEGRINVRELSEMLQDRAQFRQKAVELLVLSACETATGDDRATLGLAGLAVKSGARSTIAALWPIKDKVAAELMIDFYQQLRTPGLTKAEALRQAQLNILKNPDYRDPFFWSPYVLVGNWR